MDRADQILLDSMRAARSDSSGTVGPPPEWPDDNDSTLT